MHNLRSFGVGGRYIVGPATLLALWTNTLVSPIAGSSTLYNAYEAGGKYAFTPALSGALGYTYSRASGSATAHWNQINAAVDYALSKRTDVYFLTVYQDASGRIGTTNVQAQIGDSISSIFPTSGTGSQDQVAVRVAIRHNFQAATCATAEAGGPPSALHGAPQPTAVANAARRALPGEASLAMSR